MSQFLFIIGILITISGWLVERAPKFQWLMRRIDPSYLLVLSGLEELEKGPELALTKNHRSFSAIICKWPELKNRESVTFIGRTVAYMSFGPTVSHDIQLIAYDAGKNEIPNRWNFSDAKKIFKDNVEHKLFKIGALAFWSGILISVVSYVLSTI